MLSKCQLSLKMTPHQQCSDCCFSCIIKNHPGHILFYIQEVMSNLEIYHSSEVVSYIQVSAFIKCWHQVKLNQITSMNLIISPLSPGFCMHTKYFSSISVFICSFVIYRLSGEMRCLRQAANTTRRDRLRNDNIRQLLGTTPCLKYTKKQRIEWFG